jgi:hypothetical protein
MRRSDEVMAHQLEEQLFKLIGMINVNICPRCAGPLLAEEEPPYRLQTTTSRSTGVETHSTSSAEVA